MVNYIQRMLFLLVLSGVLTGFAVEQLYVFSRNDSICLADCDVEKKDKGEETKKFGEEDKLYPAPHTIPDLPGTSIPIPRSGFSPDDDVLLTLNYRAILTPPPERI